MPVKGHPGRIHGHFSKDFSHILFTTIIYYAAVQALLHPYIYYVAEITKFIGCTGNKFIFSRTYACFRVFNEVL